MGVFYFGGPKIGQNLSEQFKGKFKFKINQKYFNILRRQFYKGLRSEFVQGVELAFLDKDLKRGQRRKLLGFLVDGLFEQLDILVPPDLDEQIEEELEWTFITAM